MNRDAEEKPDLESIEEMKHQAEKTSDRVRNTAQELLDRIRWGSREKIQERKLATASHFGTAEAAVRDAAARLRIEEQGAVATPLNRFADTVGNLSHYLENNSPEELAAQAADTMRRYPLVAVGSAFVAGLAMARVVRASTGSN